MKNRKMLVLVVLLCLEFYSLSERTLHAEDHIAEATQVAASVIANTPVSATSKNEKETNSQSKINTPTNPEDEKKKTVTLLARSTSYNKDEAKADEDTKKKNTSTQVKVGTLENLQLGAVAVDPAIIPYGSAVISPEGKVFIAIDTGSDVKSRKAATEYADTIGLSNSSPEYRAPVLDFYAYGQIGKHFDRFKVIKYSGKTAFASLRSSQKLEYLRIISRKLAEYYKA